MIVVSLMSHEAIEFEDNAMLAKVVSFSLRSDR